MTVIHPDTPEQSTGTKTYGTDRSEDLVDTHTIVDQSNAAITDNDKTTKGSTGTEVFEHVVFDSHFETNEIWVRSGGTASGHVDQLEVLMTTDGGLTWESVASISDAQNENNQWTRFRFDAEKIDGIRVRAKVSNPDHNVWVFEVEAHSSLVPGAFDSTLDKSIVEDQEVYDSSATLLTSTGKPVPEVDIDILVASEDGTTIFSGTQTTDADGQVTYGDLVDVTADYTEDTEYDIRFDSPQFRNFETFYVPLVADQTGTASTVKVFSATGQPVRGAEIYVDGVFVGTTDRSGDLDILYRDFPLKATGPYRFAAVKGRSGVGQTVPNGEEGLVKFGRLQATKDEEPTALRTTGSRYSNVY